MIVKFLNSLWAAVAPGLGDHLWQSTAVALVAALLTLTLRRNHARARYWIWLTARSSFLSHGWLRLEISWRGGVPQTP